MKGEEKSVSKLYISMYHYVRELKNSRYPDIKGLDYDLFRQQIEFFKNNFSVVTMEEVIASVQEGYDLPENALLLTFDDGYIDCYTSVFPVLKEYGFQGSFFVPGKVFREHKLLDVNKIHFLLASAPVGQLYDELLKKMDHYRGEECGYAPNEELIEKYAVANRFDTKETIFIKRMLQVVLPEMIRKKIADDFFTKYVDVREEVLAREIYMNYDQMKFMKREGMFFGSHGYDHYWMNSLTPKELEQDIEAALESMDGLLDISKWVVNYPCGSYSEDVIQYVKEKGAVLGLSTDVRIADTKKDDRFKLPRLDTNDFPPKSENYIKLG